MGWSRRIPLLVHMTLLSLGGALSVLVPLPMPDVMADCIKYRTQAELNISLVPFSTINTYCLNNLLYNTQQLRPEPPSENDTVALAYVSELFRRMMTEYEARRHKRQAFAPRIRKEIRMMTPRERKRYFQAVLDLKKQMIVPGYSQYDYIADVHGKAAQSAHNGPAFLVWHKIYILVFEYALGRGFGVPFWDSRLDFNMDDPTDSILWSPQFFGNGFGVVNTGPFANWLTIEGMPLVRNVGTGGTLITDEAVALILNQTSYGDITEPNYVPARSLEMHHNGPHVWVDGHFAGVNTAVFDPIFFSHHAFIDHIWTLFRAKNPHTNEQYPSKGPKSHASLAPMFPFKDMLNVFGLHPFYESLYEYELPPVRCPCRSPYLECSGNRCRSIQRVINPNDAVLTSASNFPLSSTRIDINVGERFKSHFIDPRTTEGAAAVALARIRRSVRNSTTAKNQKTSKMMAHSAHSTLGDKQMTLSYVNTFMLDGVQNKTAWAYIPVQIIYENRLNHSSRNNANENKEMMYGHCQTSGSGAAKFFIQTDGLDYSGRYKDYVIIDERQEISSTVAYVGVKNPKQSSAYFIMTAYDTCGRVCSPRCYKEGNYFPCSGTFYLNSLPPKGYSATRKEAEKGVWNIRRTPPAKKEKITVAFLCKTGNVFPWNFS